MKREERNVSDVAGHHNGLMLARMLSFSVWLLLGASAAYWGLQLFARPLPLPALTLQAGDGRGGAVDLARLLGSTPVAAAAEPEPQPQTSLRLLGVVAPKSERAAAAGEGVALIEVDGVARTVRVGTAVDGEIVLLRVDARSASLGRLGQPPSMVLEISASAAPATGVLTPAAPSPTVLGGNPAGLQTAGSPQFGASPAAPAAMAQSPMRPQVPPQGVPQTPPRPSLSPDEVPGSPPVEPPRNPNSQAAVR